MSLNPPHEVFRADHAGSLLRPAALTQARQPHGRSQLSADERRQREDDAIAAAVKGQEAEGLAVVTDGESRRAYGHLDFLTSFASVQRTTPKVAAQFQHHSGRLELQAHGLEVTGKLAQIRPFFADQLRYLKPVSSVTPKITIPSPSVLHFRGGRAAIDEQAYPAVELFFADLASAYAAEIADLARCDDLQIGDTHFAYLCDPGVREQARALHAVEPGQLAYLYARLINEAIQRRPPSDAGDAACVRRQLPQLLGGRGRLCAGRRGALQRGQGGRLLPGIRRQTLRGFLALEAAAREQGRNPRF